MKSLAPVFLIIILCHLPLMHAQNNIPLPIANTPDNIWQYPEREYFSTDWQTQVVTNVSTPTLQAFLAPKDKNTGVTVVIAPGGGLYALSIQSEGVQVAKWLNNKGINAFVLKYRLVPTGQDGAKEINDLSVQNPQKIMQEVPKILPLAIEDGLQAITYLRSNAKKYNLDPNKIGFMGFSAGGAVLLGIADAYTNTNKPNFLVPVYPWTDAYTLKESKKDLGPTFIICATDDPLNLALGATQLYLNLFKNKVPVAMHMYAKGGHGFGMRTQNLPSDNWINRFYEWAIAQQIISVDDRF